MIAVGAANGFAAYCSWRAEQISVSLSAIFGFMDDVIAVSLGCIILNETKYLGTGISIGLALCASTTVLLAISNYCKKKTGEKHIAPRFFLYVFGYTVIWGIATFLTKYWAIEDVPITTFAVSWYSGAFMMTLVIFIINKLRGLDAEIENAAIPIKKTLAMTSVAGAFICGAIFLLYWALQLAPLTVVKPILFVAGLVPPMLVGIFLFKEKSQYKGAENAMLAQAVIGALFLAFSFN